MNKMRCKIENNSDLNIDEVEPLLSSLYGYIDDRLKFTHPATIQLNVDPDDAGNPLRKTAHYQPHSSTVTVFVDGRHLKDVLRSIAHELIHHHQNCKGAFDRPIDTSLGYAQTNPFMRGLEKQAYKLGNIFFRDWEDSMKQTLNENTDNGKKEVMKGNENNQQPKKVETNDQWYQNTLYQNLIKRWVKK
tara:strand:+ start:646 stop:1212 length:567 start_codon:yes stop_codon:yes gene_type:complete